MAEYIFRSENDSHSLTRGIEDMCALMPKDWYGTLHEEIVRCRDCEHATISKLGVCKYCDMFWLPDLDGYGADPQVCLPLDFFCAYGERKVDE